VVARSTAPEAELIALDRSIRRIIVGLNHEETVTRNHKGL
jgi:hypothetical protein